MEIAVSYISGLKFEATSRGHVIIGDQPQEGGGEDAGMHPQEWLLSAMGSCVAFYVVKYCQARGLDHSGLRVFVSAHKSKEPPLRMEGFQIKVDLPIPLSPRHLKGIERAASSCIIHNTLSHPNEIKTVVHGAD